jgi:hypothetical protein
MSVESLLDDVTGSSIYTKESEQELIPVQLIELEEGEIDPRLKNLSHSSRTMLHKCPRKYQLYRLTAKQTIPTSQEELVKDAETGVTFSYGTAVGVGIASVLEGKTEDRYLLETFLSWEQADILDVTPRHNKSIWTALFAVQKFATLKDTELLEDYELVYYTSPNTGEKLPAVELSFIIKLPDGFNYRGFVDAVLRHKDTGDIIVLECKTSSGSAQPAAYKNSGQALGYSVILDILFPKLSSYSVYYLVYGTKTYEFDTFIYEKSLLQRALWLQELIIDKHIIELYDAYDTYPMHGESCFDFFRECEYMGLCTLTTENLTKPLTQKVLDEVKKANDLYEFVISFEDLVHTQIAKGEV